MTGHDHLGIESFHFFDRPFYRRFANIPDEVKTAHDTVYFLDTSNFLSVLSRIDYTRMAAPSDNYETLFMDIQDDAFIVHDPIFIDFPAFLIPQR